LIGLEPEVSSNRTLDRVLNLKLLKTLAENYHNAFGFTLFRADRVMCGRPLNALSFPTFFGLFVHISPLIHCSTIDTLEMSDFDLIAFDEMAQIRAYFQSNNMEGVHATLYKLHDTVDDEVFQAKTIPLLYEAVEKNSFRLICCFLENHVSLDSQLVVKATTNTLYQALEAFLTHGWDINTPVDWNTPGALA
jgi:hypothetical protein